MRITIKSENGSFDIGGGADDTCRLLAISGIGLVGRSAATVKFTGAAGEKLIDVSANSRTITMSFDINADEYVLNKIMRIMQDECELIFYLHGQRRKITARMIEAIEPEIIIYRQFYKMAVQFYCEYPYFTDLSELFIPISTRTDHFPTSIEEGEAYITLPAIATTRESTATVINFGDIPTYPTITVTADKNATSIILKNNTTGLTVTLEKNVDKGESVTFDFGNRKITSSENGSVVQYLTDSSLISQFVLSCGKNEILVTDNNSAELPAVISYKNKYLGVVI